MLVSILFIKTLINRVKELNHKNEALALINGGENSHVEFKSTLRWDIRLEKRNPEIEVAVLKTIAAFINTDGGNLFIGIDDNGVALGLDNDFKTLKKKDIDGFEQYLMQLISLKLGTHLCTAVNVSFYRYGENDVCYIEIDPAKTPVYLSQDGRSRFYIRTGNGTRELDLPEAILHLGKKKALYN
ncbi:ATP-binding protein [bacterium]|nr:ATP-binding protein [bacterium]